MAERSKKKKCPPVGLDEWMGTYGDMVTLLLVFFVILANPKVEEGIKLKIVGIELAGFGPITGGNTLSKAKVIEAGSNFRSLQTPTVQQEQRLSQVEETFKNVLQKEIRDGSVTVQITQRGLTVSLAADAFFPIASARLRIERARGTLNSLAMLLTSDAVSERPVKIEGYTDKEPTDPEGPWPTNWELSTDRGTNVLHYLSALGVPETRFEVSGFGSTRLKREELTAEDTAANRRVDIVILSEGNL